MQSILMQTQKLSDLLKEFILNERNDIEISNDNSMYKQV